MDSIAQVKINQLYFCIWGKDTTSELRINQGLEMNLNNLINHQYHNQMTINVPEVELKFFVVGQVENSNEWLQKMATNRLNNWFEVAKVKSCLNLRTGTRYPDWMQDRTTQMDFLKNEDQLTRRCSQYYEIPGSVTVLENADDEFFEPARYIPSCKSSQKSDKNFEKQRYPTANDLLTVDSNVKHGSASNINVKSSSPTKTSPSTLSIKVESVDNDNDNDNPRAHASLHGDAAYLHGGDDDDGYQDGSSLSYGLSDKAYLTSVKAGQVSQPIPYKSFLKAYKIEVDPDCLLEKTNISFVETSKVSSSHLTYGLKSQCLLCTLGWR